MKSREKAKAGEMKVRLPHLLLLAVLATVYSGCTVVRSAPETLPTANEAGVKRYFLQQRVWTLRDSFVITDGFRNPIFFVKGKTFSIGDHLKFIDGNGNERLDIRQKLFSLRRLFKIYRDGELFARMTKRIRIFTDKYVIDVPGTRDYIVKGDFPRYHYDIYRGGRRVAQISKRWPAWTDHYRIDIVPGEDDLILLAAAVIVDMVSHRNDDPHMAMIHH